MDGAGGICLPANRINRWILTDGLFSQVKIKNRCRAQIGMLIFDIGIIHRRGDDGQVIHRCDLWCIADRGGDLRGNGCHVRRLLARV